MRLRKACESSSKQRRLAFRQCRKHWLFHLSNGQAILYLKLPALGAKAPPKSDSSEKKGTQRLEKFCGNDGFTPTAEELFLAEISSSLRSLTFLESAVSVKLRLRSSP